MNLALRVGIATALFGLSFCGVARADLIFQIGSDSNFSGSGSPTGPFGTVTLTDGTGTGAGQNGILTGTVQVSLALSPNVFANTGAADSFEFSLSGSPTITTADITNLLFTGTGVTSSSAYALDTTPSVPNGANVKGFGLGISCTACGKGTSAPQYDALTFDITHAGGLSSASFVPGDIAGYYFLADIGIVDANGNVITTGYSGALGPNTPPDPVPEPASWTLFAAGLLGLLLLRGRASRAR
jgi:PEP-CTERM motif